MASSEVTKRYSGNLYDVQLSEGHAEITLGFDAGEVEELGEQCASALGKRMIDEPDEEVVRALAEEVGLTIAEDE